MIQGPAAEGEVALRVEDADLQATLAVPPEARGLVAFAHGSGSSRFSPRNRFVARQLQEAGMATLLADLLTPGEEQQDLRTRALRFDIGLLARRVAGLVDAVEDVPDVARLPLGLFGSSTGAAAALVAAALRPRRVHAVVSRGGRPDLAGDALEQVCAPVLLVVGSRDPEVLALNEHAAARLLARRELAVVEGATHLFEEPGALEQVAGLAAGWFADHLAPRASRPTTA